MVTNFAPARQARTCFEPVMLKNHEVFKIFIFFYKRGSKHVLTALQGQNLSPFFNITSSKHVLTALQGQNLSPFFNITSSKHVLTALQEQNLSPFFNITSSKHVLTALQGQNFARFLMFTCAASPEHALQGQNFLRFLMLGLLAYLAEAAWGRRGRGGGVRGAQHPAYRGEINGRSDWTLRTSHRGLGENIRGHCALRNQIFRIRKKMFDCRREYHDRHNKACPVILMIGRGTICMSIVIDTGRILLRP